MPATAGSPPVTRPASTGQSSSAPRPEHIERPSHTDPIWHTLSVDDVIARLATGLTGLASAEAWQRLHVYGPNELQAVKRVSAWHTFAAQFKNALIVILLAATILSGFLGHTLEAVVITVIVLFAVLLGFIQEHRAGRALEALKKMAAPSAHVLRDGDEVVVPTRELVPGDVVLLRTGDRVPADARVTLAVNLAVDEAALTGESAAVQKTVARFDDAQLSLGDRKNMTYAGTLVTYGRGQAVVVSTGMSTEFGHVARLVESVEASRTPLQANLDRLGATLGKAALGVVGLVVAIGLARGLPVIDMFMFGIALAVAVVPEALPAVVTISLAIGVRRMVRRNALVRRLPIVETLGSTSVICTDKTGTVTRNEMTVRQVLAEERLFELSGAGYDPAGQVLEAGRAVEPTPGVRALLQAGVLASDARLVSRDGRWQVEGDPTEGALIVAATKAGLNPVELNQQAPRVAEIPFTSERRRMTTLHTTAAGVVAFSKGAADEVLASCTSQLRSGEDVPLTESALERIRASEQRMAGEGLRVLAVARKSATSIEDAESRMTLLGLVAMMDPPRAEARDAVRVCEAAGIRAVMITGDHPLTASTIAGELGMLKNWRVVSGRELEAMSDGDLERDVADIAVYARVSPADKLRVVTAWQHRGEVVAMTGDGVNDAPAIKKADVGIAMGITGTDVSKEAAGMTLLDDNFATIVASGRRGAHRLREHQEVPDVSAFVQCRRDRAAGGRRDRGIAAAALGGADSLRESRHRRAARPGAGGRSSGAGPDAEEAERPARGHLHAAGRGVAARGRIVVRSGQHRPLHMAPAIAAAPGGHGDDVRHARADPVLQRVQLPVRSAVGGPAAVREPLAQHGRRLGARAARRHPVRALFPTGVRDVQHDAGRLDAHDRPGVLDCPRPRSGEVVCAARLVRGTCLIHPAELNRSSGAREVSLVLPAPAVVLTVRRLKACLAGRGHV